MPADLRVMVRSAWTNALLAAFILVFGLVFISGVGASKVPGFAKALLVLAFALSLVLAGRAIRSGLSADVNGLRLRGFVRTQDITWDEVASVTAVSSGNISGAASCVGIILKNGKTVRVRGAASYSRKKVDGLCRQVLGVAPPPLRPD